MKISKIKSCFAKKKKYLLMFLVILSVILIAYFFSNKENLKIYTVSLHDVEQAVLLSGVVQSTNQVDLAFDASGRVEHIFVSQGDVVEEGTVLAQLDVSSVDADIAQAQGALESAYASVSSAQASVDKAKANLGAVFAQTRGLDSSLESARKILEDTIVEQNALVKSAYVALLNNDLQAYMTGSIRNLAPPNISGSYDSLEEGVYILKFYNSGAQTGYSASVSGLEIGSVSFDQFGMPSALGTRGLYISLPENPEFNSYGYSQWEVPVPNTRSSTYQVKLAAYEKALQTQKLAVSRAQTNLDTLLAQEDSGDIISLTTAQQLQAQSALDEAYAGLQKAYSVVTQAKAALQKAEAQKENRIIKAPFEGTVAREDFQVGESVMLGVSGITLIAENKYELEMNISEMDITRVNVGDEAQVMLDVYGDTVIWKGVVSQIDAVETKIDGVPSYVATIVIDEPDARMKVGMNARAKIIIDERSDVVAIPESYIVNNQEVQTVLVRTNKNQIEERPVVLGLKGSGYFVEVVEGLSVGDQIISPTNQ